VYVVFQTNRRATAFRENAQSILNDIDVAPARVHPLRYITEEGRGVRVSGIEVARPGPHLIEARHTTPDLAMTQIFPQPF
jgi:hypothetical protein